MELESNQSSQTLLKTTPNIDGQNLYTDFTFDLLTFDTVVVGSDVVDDGSPDPSLYFKPTDGFVGEVNLSVEVETVDGMNAFSIADNIQFEINPGAPELNYITWDFSSTSSQSLPVFTEDITLQYELNTDSYQFWRDAANRIINDLHPEYNGLLVSLPSDAFQSEASWVNAINSGTIQVREVVPDQHGMSMHGLIK